MACIIGIDPGVAFTGYGVLRPEQGRRLHGSVVEAGLVETEPGRPLADRLHVLYRSIYELCREYRPQVVAIEDLYTHYDHPRTAVLMGHARGVVLLAAQQSGAQIVSFAPARIKKALTGNGNAAKRQVQRMTQQILALPAVPEPDHVADALAAAICYCFTSDVVTTT